jgi:hypothetical protein
MALCASRLCWSVVLVVLALARTGGGFLAINFKSEGQLCALFSGGDVNG